MSAFRIGDLVIVTKPSTCCGNANYVGTVFVISALRNILGQCRNCKSLVDASVADGINVFPVNVQRLTKVDPPFIEENRISKSEASHA